tara:strand:- start:740 stop:3163 length:2424 start_codon:yes stop_codon:yes gene_type:complete
MTEEYIEKFNVRNAEYVYHASASEFNAFLYDKSEADSNNQINKMLGYDQLDKLVYRKQVKRFCKKIIDNKGTIVSTYKTSYKNSKMGRQYVVEFGCQSLQYRLRGFLLDKSYIDYDCINMHPCILRYLITKKLKSVCPLLNDYCDNRDKIMSDHSITKHDVLVAINSDISYSKKPWIKLLFQEIQPFKQRLLDLEEYNKIKTMNDTNPVSSRVNKIFCIIEDRIITDVEKWKNLTRLIKMFDGVMTPIPLGIDNLDKRTEIYNIKWKVKEPDTYIKLPDLWESPSEEKIKKQKYKEDRKIQRLQDAKDKKIKKQKDKEQKEIQKQIQSNEKIESKLLEKAEIKKCKAEEKEQKKIESHKEFMVVKETFEKTRFMIEQPTIFCTETKFGLQSQNITNFSLVNASMPKIDGKPFIGYWLENNPRKYSKFDFIPYNKSPPFIHSEIYNLFKPLTFANNRCEANEKDGQELVDLVLTLLDILAGGKLNSGLFLKNCISHMIQYPNILKETIIFLGGAEGVGKDTIIDLIAALLDNPDYVLRTAKPDLIFGQFNSSCEAKLIIQINESSAANAIRFLEDMKDFSTSQVVNVHKKGQEPYQVNNHSMVWFCSNNCNGIAPSNSNRRVAAFWASDHLKGDRVFFKRLKYLMKDRSVLQYVFDYFNNSDISTFDITALPKSSLLDDLQLSGIKPIYRFVKKILTEPHDVLKKDNNQALFLTSDFKRKYDKYLTDNGHSFKVTTQKIKLDIREFSMETRKHGKRRSDHYFFDTKKTLAKLEKDYFKDRETIDDSRLFYDHDVISPFMSCNSDDELD